MKVKAKGLLNKNDVIVYFENIIKGLNEGQIVMRQGDDLVTLLTMDQMKLEISAEETKSKSTILIELNSKKEKEKPKEEELTITASNFDQTNLLGEN